MYVCFACTYISALPLCLVLEEARKRALDLLELGSQMVLSGQLGVAQCVCRQLNPGPQQQHRVLLTAEHLSSPTAEFFGGFVFFFFLRPGLTV